MRDVILLVPGACIFGLCGNLYTMLWAGFVSDIGAFIVIVIFVTIECKKISRLAKASISEDNSKENNQTWGDRNNYDLCVDTSKLGVTQTIDIIENYIYKRIK